MPFDDVIKQLPSRIRRKFARSNINRHRMERFLTKLARAKKACGVGQRPKPVRTHYRNMVVLPEMVGSQIAIYNGKVFMDVEIKVDMIGHYLGEFAITYKPVTHGKYGATTAKVTNSKMYQVHY
ncbi:40S ribosomal protein S15 [Gregarina niphandrodes]|uniref:40S ribosomal protein S15 n=1 Tax=Gregarina niphandrodes TaxID=110365 RepID=A0A023BBF6_GRENI|nr:40S ribosomal protein S15 [Gregarina niphandrodes]EZG79300.1 40S ribosomal protein S15 [Gregarina niphandrodes]|eukprot:XP_011129069.1 40S ribosomal protein S15 [Gregarina niphandrodes]